MRRGGGKQKSRRQAGSEAGFDIPPPRPFPVPPADGPLPTRNPMQQLHAYWRMEYIAAPRYPERMERPFTELPALGDDRVALSSTAPL